MGIRFRKNKKEAAQIIREPISFVCWKWKPFIDGKKGISFTSQHVNILFAMLRRHMRDPFELVCITDNADDIHPKIRIVPLWNDLKETPGCFRRLKIFSPEMKQIIGPRIVSIDLDCVIVNDITSLFQRDEDFVIWGSIAGVPRIVDRSGC